MIYNMVHNEQDAWDLAQDSFVKAWKSIDRFRGKSSFYTWLYRIVMNVTIDWLRKNRSKEAGQNLMTMFNYAKSIRPRKPFREPNRCPTSEWKGAKCGRRIDRGDCATFAGTPRRNFDEGNRRACNITRSRKRSVAPSAQ